jgi:hypothetical protein
MPTGLIHHYNSVSARSDGERYFCQMERHGFRITQGQHQAGALAMLRADCAEDIDRFSSLTFASSAPKPPFLRPPSQVQSGRVARPRRQFDIA